MRPRAIPRWLAAGRGSRSFRAFDSAAPRGWNLTATASGRGIVSLAIEVVPPAHSGMLILPRTGAARMRLDLLRALSGDGDESGMGAELLMVAGIPFAAAEAEALARVLGLALDALETETAEIGHD
ncbi:MAG: hypothetical protein FP826_01535 [Sphingomonadales bacterium]|nr:hypothetical protein [Sphingomonadales bacterium]MBU3993745.1 hypothetical protein [Alphaproteobacteria bacterium]